MNQKSSGVQIPKSVPPGLTSDTGHLPGDRIAVQELLSGTAGAAVATIAVGGQPAATPEPPLPQFAKRQQCKVLSEPSGVVQLADGRVLVVEDEKKNPVSVLTFKSNLTFTTEALRTKSPAAALNGGQSLGALADLEAVDRDDRGFVYAITSFSPTKSGKRPGSRTKLVRFKVDGNRAFKPGILVGFRPHWPASNPN